MMHMTITTTNIGISVKYSAMKRSIDTHRRIKEVTSMSEYYGTMGRSLMNLYSFSVEMHLWNAPPMLKRTTFSIRKNGNDSDDSLDAITY